jgi:hypothetical protein
MSLVNHPTFLTRTKHSLKSLGGIVVLCVLAAPVMLPQTAHAQPYVFGASQTRNPSDGNTRLSLNGGAIILNSIDRGWYSHLGFHSTLNDSYATGTQGTNQFHNFFYFDLSGVSTSIISANLLLFNPSNGYNSPDSTGTYSIYDITTSEASMLGGTGGLGAYTDLDGGVLYGFQTVSANDNGQVVSVNLNGSALADLNTQVGIGHWGTGGNLTASVAAPEPCTLALLGIGSVVGFACQRKRNAECQHISL